MPREETFFEQHKGSLKVTVLKSYDQGFARESFQEMDEIAHEHLWAALKPEEVYEPAELPKLGDPNDTEGEAEAFLWDELLEQSREDGNTLSFFIVNESVGHHTKSVYVSPDWPSAESFALARLADFESVQEEASS